MSMKFRMLALAAASLLAVAMPAAAQTAKAAYGAWGRRAQGHGPEREAGR